jgi:hypothetical protein
MFLLHPLTSIVNHLTLPYMAQLKPEHRRTKSIMLRLTPAEYGQVVKAAKGKRSLSDFVRAAIQTHTNMDASGKR